MPASLFTVLNAMPEFAGRVYFDVAPQTPTTPFVIVWNPPEGMSRPYDRGSGLYNAPVAATVYTKPATGGSTNAARLQCEELREQIMAINPNSVDTSLGGIPYVRGSFALQVPFEVRPDKSTTGQFYATVQFMAQIFRVPNSS